MAPLVPTCTPSIIVAGDSAIWTRAFGDFPIADGWTATYALRGASVADVTATTDVDGTSFLFTVTPGISGPLAAGQYHWRIWVSLSGVIHTAESGIVTVEANPYTATAGDLVSSAETELALIEAQIAELLASPTESYSIAQRSAQKRSLQELYTLRGTIVAKLGRQRGQQLPDYAMGFRAVR